LKDISTIVLQNLIKNSKFCEKVIPFIKDEYFSDPAQKKIFNTIFKHYSEYNSTPNLDVLGVELSSDKTVNESLEKEIEKVFDELKDYEDNLTEEWLVDRTEKFCQEMALFNGLMTSVAMFQDKKGIAEIPEILKEALSVSFDTSIGHDFLDDFEERYEYYTKPEHKVEFLLKSLNEITKGGFSNKTLNLFLATTHGGKSALMCSLAADNLLSGKNVLYLTMEMAEEEIAKRIEANLFNMEMDDIQKLPFDSFTSKIKNIVKKTSGKLIIQEYPTGVPNVGNFKILLRELLLKKNFKPDIIYIDYLNLCSSFRLKGNTTANSFTYYKVIAEEVRGFAQEMKLPIVSASQFNRGGATNSDPDMDNISESFGVAFTGDFVAAIIATEELIEQGVVSIKQLKNRYSDKNKKLRFMLGFDRPKMKFYDVDNPGKIKQTTNTMAEDSVFQTEEEYKETIKSKNKFDKFKF
jgi:replicative DNA helicase